MEDIQQLAARIRAVSAKIGVEPSTLSRKLLGSGVRLAEIEAGGTITMTTFARVRDELDAMERAA